MIHHLDTRFSQCGHNCRWLQEACPTWGDSSPSAFCTWTPGRWVTRISHLCGCYFGTPHGSLQSCQVNFHSVGVNLGFQHFVVNSGFKLRQSLYYLPFNLYHLHDWSPCLLYFFFFFQVTDEDGNQGQGQYASPQKRPLWGWSKANNTTNIRQIPAPRGCLFGEPWGQCSKSGLPFVPSSSPPNHSLTLWCFSLLSLLNLLSLNLFENLLVPNPGTHSLPSLPQAL